MKKLVYSILILNFLFASCSNNDDNNDSCGIVNCSAPNRILEFDLIDKSTRKNIFVDNKYEANLLEVFNSDNNKIEFQFIDTENYIIAINLITSNPDIGSYIFKISDKILFKLVIETKSNNDECCPFIIYSKVDISDNEFNINSQNGTYEIIIE